MTAPLPELPPGTVLEVAKDDWRCGGFRLFLRVESVRPDLSVYYENEWIWISGTQLSRDGTPVGHLDALVRVAALSDLPAPRSGRPERPGSKRTGPGRSTPGGTRPVRRSPDGPAA
ncbi:hypothetical protein ACFQ0D_27450, partial [Micromonospora zhanjiangensis]